MRAAVRPLVLLVAISGFAAIAHSEGDGLAGANTINFASGSPYSSPSGIDVTVVQKAGTNYTCIRITIQLIDASTGTTIDSFIIENPGETVGKTFTGIGINAQVSVDAVFQNGFLSDTKHIESAVIPR
jgi:hypothetical protein